MEAARRLFSEHGYDGTRVEDITREAGVAVGTFFNYFPGKDAILQELQGEGLREAVQHARSLVTGSAEERFRAQFRFLAQRARDRGGALTRVFMGRIMVIPAITGPNRPLVYELFDVYATWLDEGQRRGEVRADVHPMTAATILHELWSHTSLRWSTHPHEIDLDARMTDRIDVVFRGLR